MPSHPETYLTLSVLQSLLLSAFLAPVYIDNPAPLYLLCPYFPQQPIPFVSLLLSLPASQLGPHVAARKYPMMVCS